MKIAAMIVGIFGAIAGFGGSILAFFVAFTGAIVLGGPAPLAVWSLGALIMSIVGLVGAALSIAKPKVAVVLMALSAIIGVILIVPFYIVATILLLIAALLAFLGRKS